MRQITLSVALEVKPESSGKLAALIDLLHDSYHVSGTDYAAFMTKVPCVHFLSMSVLAGGDYDPLFLLEANFDGEPGVFWGQMEAAVGGDLRAMLRCCKRPLDSDGPLYDSVTDPNSCVMVVPYLEARTRPPSVFFQGNRGMTRDRILQERALFLATRNAVAGANPNGPSPYRGVAPDKIHSDLRKAMVPQFPWLDKPAPARIPPLERLMDRVKLLAFVIGVIVCLSLPATLLALLMPTNRLVILLLAISALIWAGLYELHDPLPGTDTHGKMSIWTVMLRPLRLLLVLALGVVIVFPSVFVMTRFLMNQQPHEAVLESARASLFGLVGMCVAMVPGLLLWLRWLERRDSAQDAPPVNEDVVRQMAQREDWIPQNHMVSAVLIRPGILRTIIIHAGHLGLGLFLRVTATDGRLGSMRTVHFAHWAFANNKSRLLFFSNFDQSWGSYLDDFIEKAHEGLTLAWGCGVGFPTTRLLIQDGASNGRKFKAWARHSMDISRFWYSAYSDLTVDQVERNFRIANGLRSKQLSPQEASTWLTDL